MSEVDEHFEPQVSEPPREVTAHAARHAWGDMRVRFWWLCGLALAVIMLIVAGDRMLAATRERQLIATGTQVRATVLMMDQSTRLGYALPRTDSHEVRLKVKLPDGQNQTYEGRLQPGGGMLVVGGEIDIKVDPKDPTRWTDRTEAVSWLVEMIIPLLILPLVLLVFAIALWRRSQVLRIWRQGQSYEGVVIELRHSAAAPLSRLIRYNIPDRDKRIFTTLMPARVGVPQPGESIEIIAMPDALERAVVAKVYES
ncbi:MAG TPA: hypothetical protein VF669_19140 [Tepidisphaeraceae bacterium]